ncbi:hypothetical protein SBV1_660003 [Verrucomicrobia bacterium]|nr:hypothetical protein SBV1_660003 [Verrucomicrobiota bacterium]
MQLPRQLKTLDDLLAQAEHYADFSMRNLGHLPLTLFLIGADKGGSRRFVRRKCRTRKHGW